MATDATGEESAMLVNRVTGDPREVDVVIRGNAASHEVVVAIEATSSKRMATVEWVERMVGKHQHLPTDKLVLVSEMGFRPQARTAAAAAGVAAFSPEDLDVADPALDVLDQLRSLWPKLLSFYRGAPRSRSGRGPRVRRRKTVPASLLHPRKRQRPVRYRLPCDGAAGDLEPEQGLPQRS